MQMNEMDTMLCSQLIRLVSEKDKVSREAFLGALDQFIDRKIGKATRDLKSS